MMTWHVFSDSTVELIENYRSELGSYLPLRSMDDVEGVMLFFLKKTESMEMARYIDRVWIDNILLKKMNKAIDEFEVVLNDYPEDVNFTQINNRLLSTNDPIEPIMYNTDIYDDSI